MANSYDFGTEGVYNVGVTIVFSEGYGCDDVVYETFHTVSFDGLTCQVTESNEEGVQGTSTMSNAVEEVITSSVAPTMFGTELLGEVDGDWTGTNAPTMMMTTAEQGGNADVTLSASTVAVGADVLTSPSPSSSATATIITKDESSSSPFASTDLTTTAPEEPKISPVPTTYMPTMIVIDSSSLPSAMPRTGTEPIPVSKNMLTSSSSSSRSRRCCFSSVYSIMSMISTVWIAVYILH